MSKNIVKDAQDACGEGNEKKKSKAMWDDASVETFISICVAETLAGNQTETGLGWDPVKQTIIASDEWWEKKVKENSEVANIEIV
ncbi:hypothetical protein PS2_018241 [Malus domestica]